MNRLTSGEWRWMLILIFASTMTLSVVEDVEIDPFAEVTVPFVVFNFLLAIGMFYFIATHIEIIFGRRTSLIARIYYDAYHSLRKRI